MSEDEFVNSGVTYDAYVLNFFNIGEQVKSFSDAFKEQYPDIPYRKTIGFRNIAAHSYEGLEAFRLYNAIREDVPKLYEQVIRIIKSNEVD